ncbi:MAG: penicillin acylase family protein [Myxococcota bacterium]|nr:penicillin acylase family protein [Myxococcota bacterium]
MGTRWRQRLQREVHVWGLRAPVDLEEADNHYRISASSPADAALSEGFLTAHLSMLAMDLRRRLWSGRLAEIHGRKKLNETLSVDQLDLFVRILGFRHAAEQRYRGLGPEERRILDAHAMGINGWIDGGYWQQQSAWKELDSRPRLWSGAESLLLDEADRRLHISVRLPITIPPSSWEAGWNEEWDQQTRLFWAQVRGVCSLGSRSIAARRSFDLAIEVSGHSRRVQAVAGLSSLLEPSTPTGTAPMVLPEQVLEGGDNHRYHREGQRPARLQARRQDIDRREGAPWRHWVRHSSRGGLISDLLQGAEGVLAPSGQAFVWHWPEEQNSLSSQGDGAEEGGDSATGNSRFYADCGVWHLPELRGSRLRKTRLVPMESGA